MGTPMIDIVGSYRHEMVTGAVTTIAAATATAGHLLALRNASAALALRLRRLEVEFLLTAAFGAAQEVGFDAVVARAYSVAHSGATALDFTGNTGKKRTTYPPSVMTGRIANAGALTAGTHVLDTNPVASGSAWMAGVGSSIVRRVYDFSDLELGGLIFAQNEGLVIRNLILMGATGVGKWFFSADMDDVLLSN
jgi:hypothetical protein